MEVSGHIDALVALPLGEDIPPDTYWIGGWVAPRTGLNAVVKRKISFPC